mgnify:CR=1 FL=1
MGTGIVRMTLCSAWIRVAHGMSRSESLSISGSGLGWVWKLELP